MIYLKGGYKLKRYYLLSLLFLLNSCTNNKNKEIVKDQEFKYIDSPINAPDSLQYNRPSLLSYIQKER